MRIRSICILACILISVAAVAQGKTTFHSLAMAGISAGKSGDYGILQIVNGLEYKKIFAGIGAGIDYYRNRSIPLFFDIRTTVAKTNMYVFGDIGYNFASHDSPGREVNYVTSFHYFGGIYTELGIGYKILLGSKHYLLLSSGYSYKELNNKVSNTIPCADGGCPVDYSKYRYGYGRIIFKAGVSL